MGQSVSPVRRLAARFLDALIELGVGGVLAVLWIDRAADTDDTGWGVIGLLFVAGSIVVAVVILYEVGFVAWRGQTPGKMAARLRIVTLAGDRAGVARATVRLLPMLLVIIPVLGYAVAAAAYGLALADADGRGFHDRIAGTLVVDARRARPDG